MNAQPAPLKIRIASPCNSRWEDMSGDDRVRHCAACNKSVYNLSVLTQSQVTDLIREREGRFCGRMFKRPDGTLLTADCPTGAARRKRRFQATMFGGVAAFFFAVLNINAFSASNGRGTNVVSDEARRVLWAVKGWLGLNPKPVPMLGEICIPVSAPPAPQISPAPKNSPKN